MANKASSPTLKKAFTDHLKETEGHVVRLEKIGKELEISLKGKTCAAMKGLVEEGKEVIDEDGEPAIIDAALIGAAQTRGKDIMKWPATAQLSARWPRRRWAIHPS